MGFLIFNANEFAQRLPSNVSKHDAIISTLFFNSSDMFCIFSPKSIISTSGFNDSNLCLATYALFFPTSSSLNNNCLFKLETSIVS